MSHSKVFRLWVLVALFLVGNLAGAPVDHTVHAAAQRSLAQDNIVISEFRTQGQNGQEDYYVEIFNPTASTIDIGGWSIQAVNNSGGLTTRYTFPTGQQLVAGQHYLVAGSSYNMAVPSDGSFSPGGIPNNGGIALTLADQTIIDKVGMSILSAEGIPLAQLTDPTQSYERKPGGVNGSCFDSNNNVFDFTTINPGDPQNLTSALTICAGPTDTPTSTQTATPTLTPTASATSTPSAALHVVISEFRSQGPFGADDEFIELYNPTGAAVNIGGWIIKRSSSCGTSSYNLLSITSGTILQAGQHFLAATTASHIPSPDQNFSPAITDDGGLALVNASGSVVDQVGMCISTLYREGTNLVPLSGNTNQSYERRPGGSTSCYDLDNNAADFALISPSQPQNKASPILMCTGVVTSTPTRTPTATPTRTPIPTATSVAGTVVINEFLPHPHTDWNGDGIANTGDEYIELINMGSVSISLNNWKLDNGVGGPSVPYTLPNVTLLPRQIMEFYHSASGIGLSDGGGTVRLLKSDGRTADIFNYPFIEATDQSWCRLPDGTGSWAFACYPTPGKLNKPIGSGTIPLAGRAGTDPLCLAGTAPQVVLSAECNSPGLKMWGESGYGEFWLDSHGKWAVFVE
ncbi:MAG TPA: lamin tail domain-containing protein [Anaerolineales bacterium]